MTDNQGAGSAPDGQAPTGDAPPAGTRPSDGGQAPTSTPTTPPPSDDPDAGLSEADLRAALKKTRAEAAGYRTKVREHEEAVEAAKRAGMSEVERLKTERDEAKAAAESSARLVKTLTVRSAVLEAATKAGFRNPEIAYRLIDMDALDVTDDGKVRGIEGVLRTLLEKDPYLGTPKGGDFGGGPRGGAGAGVDMNAFIRRAAGKG